PVPLTCPEQYALSPAPQPSIAAGEPNGRSIGVESYHFERIVLEVRATIAARLEPKAVELARDVGRYRVELRARRGAAEHRVVGDDADAALDVGDRDGRCTTRDRSQPLRGRQSGEHREQQRRAESHRSRP